MKFIEINSRRYNASSARLTEPVRRPLTKRQELQRKLFEKKMERNATSSVKDTGWYVVE